MRYRARRRFLSRDWRSLWGLRFGFEIAKVTPPTRRTFQPLAEEAGGVPVSGSMLVLRGYLRYG
jgi:hypothetical protein